ncbi:MAG: hypothetical protein HZB55_01305 [Deltaproteobacteria bacterium]|nr:hypothetical protein [Deltaproteobacteria bacterium]
MPNITLSIDDELLRAGRQYAQAHDETLNGLVRKLLAQTVSNGDSRWLDECFAMMDRAQAHSGGKPWNREDLYDV